MSAELMGLDWVDQTAGPKELPLAAPMADSTAAATARCWAGPSARKSAQPSAETMARSMAVQTVPNLAYLMAGLSVYLKAVRSDALSVPLMAGR